MALPNPFDNNNAPIIIRLYLMGLIAIGYTIFGSIMIWYRDLFKDDFPPIIVAFFGGMCIIYGAYRFYRSYQDYKDSEEL
jgi:hypothetical protein